MDYDEIVEEAEFITSERDRLEYLKDNFKSENHIKYLMKYLQKKSN